MSSCLPEPHPVGNIDLRPVLAADALDGVIAHRNGQAISRAALLADAEDLAAALPADRHIVNLCVDRYNFMVGLVAALIRGQDTLLPNDLSRQGLASLARRYDRLHGLADRPIDAGPIALQRVWSDGRGDDRERRVPLVAADDTAVTLFTSGSTGEPVATRRSWTWMLATTDHYRSGLALDALGALNIVATVPAQHAFGLEGSIMLPMTGQCSVSTTMPLYPQDIVDALEAAAPPRALVTTPFHLKILIESNVRIPELAIVVSAAAHLPRELAEKAEAAVSGPVREVYGCTEVGLIATRRTVKTSDWSVPAGLDLEVDDRCAVVSAAHLPTPVSLSDAIEFTSDKTFRLRGRQTDIVKIAGKRTSLSGLNAALTGIDSVDDGTFVVWPNDGDPMNQRLVALVVAPHETLDNIRRTLRDVVPPPFAPRKVIRVDAIPRSSTGKVRAAEIAEIARKSIGSN